MAEAPQDTDTVRLPLTLTAAAATAATMTQDQDACRHEMLPRYTVPKMHISPPGQNQPKPAPFLLTLYELVDAPESDSAIRWSTDAALGSESIGCAFSVIDNSIVSSSRLPTGPLSVLCRYRETI